MRLIFNHRMRPFRSLEDYHGKTRQTGGEGQIEARLSALRQDLEALQEDMRGLGEGVGEAAQERLTEALRATESLAVQMQDWSTKTWTWSANRSANSRWLHVSFQWVWAHFWVPCSYGAED